MEFLPHDILRCVASFWDVETLTTATSVSKTFLCLVNHDGYWQQAAGALYPEHLDVVAYTYDWRAMVYDRNRKNATAVMDMLILYEENVERLYTRWTSLPGQCTKVRTIVDPFGNANVNLEEPALSVYIGINESEEDPLTLRFRVVLLCDPCKGPHRSWTCTHHFTPASSTWGVHTLIPRSQLTPESGFVTGGTIHLRVDVRVATVRLRVVETAALRQHRGRGLLAMDTEGHVREVMRGETFHSFCLRHFPLPGRFLRFWLCKYREGEGLLPVRKIREDQYRLSIMNLLGKEINELGEIVLWADRWDDGDGRCFLKRDDVFFERVSWEEVNRRGTGYVREKTLDAFDALNASETKDLDQTMVLLEGDYEHKRERDEAFAQLGQLQERHSRGHLVSMRKIIVAGARVYLDSRIMNLFHRYQDRGLLLRDLMERRHLDYACDRCGKYHFTGVRHKCTVCVDYDLCADCLGRQITPHRYRFDRGKVYRVPCTEHQDSHRFRAISL